MNFLNMIIRSSTKSIRSINSRLIFDILGKKLLAQLHRARLRPIVRVHGFWEKMGENAKAQHKSQYSFPAKNVEHVMSL